jgi:glutathione S-transferase
VATVGLDATPAARKLTPMSSPSGSRLYALKPSPWSERARWVLDHHGLEYREIEHVPFLGERRLRRVAGKPKGRVTVPVLLAGKQVLGDSWDIARYADREGRGEKLLPAELEADIRRWHDLTEVSMAAGRALTVASLLASDGALEEALPPQAPRLVRRLLRPLTRFGTRWFARKYELDLQAAEAAERAMCEGLDVLRSSLQRSPYVLGRYSYADIIAASLLQGVVPVADRYLRLGPATRIAWTKGALAARYSELVSWRDELYEQHRPRRS